MRAFNILAFSNSQRGFSLTEIMIGGGILAGVALAGAQMFKDQKQGQAKLENEQKLTIYHQGLAKKLGNPANCNATMRAAGISGGLAAGQAFTQLSECTGNCEEKNDTADLDHRAADISAWQDLVPVGSGYTDGTQTWSIQAVRNNAAVTKTGPAVLKVDYIMNPKLTGGVVKKVTKDVVLNVRYENGQFQECVNAQESSINNLQNDMCKTFNYGNVSSGGTNTGQMAVWDPITQTCSLGVNKDCSAQGWVVDGISSLGEVKCRKVSTPQGASLLQQIGPSGGNCSPTQKAVVQYDSGAKRFKVVCQ